MALVTKLEKSRMSAHRVHEEVNCTYSVFQEGNGNYLQIDTYGSRSRKLKDKKSQTIQFNEVALEQLRTILSEHFRA
jgi:hypothetical protein